MAFAAQVSVAFENAELLRQAQSVAATAERQRLARELHDSVSQALYGIALGARTARTQLDRNPAGAVEPIEYVLSLAEAGLAEMRALIFELRPESLANEGLVAALEKQVAATRARYGLQVGYEYGDEPVLPIPAKEAFYRIAQEALHNVVKHARATAVRVTLESAPGRTLLTVSDDGVGFDPEGEFPGHLGLQSMRERAGTVGAVIDVSSSTGKGTTVRLSLPTGG
jgi:signal transduction histidine kinase